MSALIDGFLRILTDAGPILVEVAAHVLGFAGGAVLAITLVLGAIVAASWTAQAVVGAFGGILGAVLWLARRRRPE